MHIGIPVSPITHSWTLSPTGAPRYLNGLDLRCLTGSPRTALKHCSHPATTLSQRAKIVMR